jgi:hypothetical protein
MEDLDTQSTYDLIPTPNIYISGIQNIRIDLRDKYLINLQTRLPPNNLSFNEKDMKIKVKHSENNIYEFSNMDLFIPHFYNSLQLFIDNCLGNIQINNINIGSLYIKYNNSCSITIENCHILNDTFIETNNSIDIKDLNTHTLVCCTSANGIKINKSNMTTLNVKSETGNIHLLACNFETCQVETNSGDLFGTGKKKVEFTTCCGINTYRIT